MSNAEIVAFGNNYLHQYTGAAFNGRPTPSASFWRIDARDDGNVTISRPIKGKYDNYRGPPIIFLWGYFLYTNFFNKILIILHQNFCFYYSKFFYTKNFAFLHQKVCFFYTKIFVFLHHKFCFFLHKILKFRKIFLEKNGVKTPN